MKSAVENLTPTRVKLNVEVPFEELKPNIEAAYKTIASQVQVPGFRKGKVPNKLIDQRVGRGYVIETAINDGLNGFYQNAVQETRGVVCRQRTGELHRLGDRDRRIDVVGVEQLEHRDPGQVAVDHGHAVERPALRVGGDHLVDAVEMRHHALDQAHRVLGHRRIAVGDALAEQLPPVAAADVGLVEDVDGALAGLGTGSHGESRWLS